MRRCLNRLPAHVPVGNAYQLLLSRPALRCGLLPELHAGVMIIVGAHSWMPEDVGSEEGMLFCQQHVLQLCVELLYSIPLPQGMGKISHHVSHVQEFAQHTIPLMTSICKPIQTPLNRDACAILTPVCGPLLLGSRFGNMVSASQQCRKRW